MQRARLRDDHPPCSASVLAIRPAARTTPSSATATSQRSGRMSRPIERIPPHLLV
jgi:hypothetical protein